MYHQPSAPPGLGGLYMFQWNDDNCETKNNFICKYTGGNADTQLLFLIKMLRNVLIVNYYFTDKPQDPSPSPNATQTSKMCSVLF